VANGERWAAKIIIDTEGIATIEGSRLVGTDFLNRVSLSRPGEDDQWPDFDGTFCEITSGGDTVDTEMTGSCSFAFVNGYALEASFKCQLVNAE
jgi:hypothetical protein